MEKYNIEDLIPQRQPFIMVDKLESFTKKEFKSSFHICSDNYFSRDNLFQEEGIIENIAQTAAAGAGYTCAIKNESIKLGYIGAIKNVVILKLPKINSKLTTVIKLTGRVMNIDLVYGEVYDQNSKLIATAEMKIFIDTE